MNPTNDGYYKFRLPKGAWCRVKLVGDVLTRPDNAMFMVSLKWMLMMHPDTEWQTAK